MCPHQPVPAFWPRISPACTCASRPVLPEEPLRGSGLRPSSRFSGLVSHPPPGQGRRPHHAGFILQSRAPPAPQPREAWNAPVPRDPHIRAE